MSDNFESDPIRIRNQIINGSLYDAGEALHRAESPVRMTIAVISQVTQSLPAWAVQDWESRTDAALRLVTRAINTYEREL